MHNIYLSILNKIQLYCSFEYVIEPNSVYGAFENGSWNGMIGMLVRFVNA